MSHIQRHWHWSVPYIETLALQQHRRQRMLQGEAELLLLAEHLPTITLGKRGGQILNTPLNTTVQQIRRGGLATWHGPGQLAFYPIIHLHKRRLGIRDFVCALESSIIDVLALYQITAKRSSSPGIWVGEKKIASIGLDVKDGISIHGAALNIYNEPRVFECIEPCGDPTLQYTNLRLESNAEHLSLHNIGLEWVHLFLKRINDKEVETIV